MMKIRRRSATAAFAERREEARVEHQAMAEVGLAEATAGQAVQNSELVVEGATGPLEQASAALERVVDAAQAGATEAVEGARRAAANAGAAVKQAEVALERSVDAAQDRATQAVEAAGAAMAEIE